MANYARVINETAVDVSVDPENHFHPDLAKEFIAVPDEVRLGWRRDKKGTWAAPQLPTTEPPPQEFRAKLTPQEFFDLWTLEERLAVENARTYTGDDASLRKLKTVLDIVFRDIEDPRTTEVDMQSPKMSTAIDVCVAGKVLTKDRAAQFKRGVPLA